MGIHKLYPLILKKSPSSITTLTMKDLSGQTIACDATVTMYQFLISTQNIFNNSGLRELTDDQGIKTAHLLGIFNRSIQFEKFGIKPIWVFDGKPPALKLKELSKRKQRKEAANAKYEEAKESGDLEEALKHKKSTTLINQQMKDDLQQMLELFGVPVIKAPSEAEAQCALLVKSGKADAVATEDMDALTFGAPFQLKNFNMQNGIVRIDKERVLQDFGMTNEQFVDLCILCGSDFCSTIEGVGSANAYNFILKYKNIENVIKHIATLDQSKRKRKLIIPDDFPYQESRDIFLNCETSEEAMNDVIMVTKNE